jgi:predicted nuclease of predicted toxin-antitoxin system
VKLLLDEIWPPAIATELRRRGHNVIAVAERLDLRGQPDEFIFDTAQAEGWTLLTENVADYLPLAATHLERGQAYAGLILTSHRRYPRSDARTIGRLVTTLDTLLSADPNTVDIECWLE